jgi:hypothetical protein
MVRLNDKEWEQVCAVTDRLFQYLRSQRDIHARSAAGHLCDVRNDTSQKIALRDAGATDALHKVLTERQMMMRELEELLHPYYDDEDPNEEESCGD